MKKLLASFFVCFVGSTVWASPQRWIVYTATPAIDCSGFLNGGKLTTSGDDTVCADDKGGDVSLYLSLSSATANYLTQSSATLTYIPLTSSSTFLTASSATATYLQRSSVTAAAPLTYSNGAFGIDNSSFTLYGPNIPASKISAGSLGSSVIASSIAVSGVTAGSYGSATAVPAFTVAADGRLSSASNTTISLTNTNLQAGTYSNVTVPAANVAAGSLGSSVIASSIAVSSVQDAAIVGVSASKLTGSQTLPNDVVDKSSITALGNATTGTGSIVRATSPTLSAPTMSDTPTLSGDAIQGSNSGTSFRMRYLSVANNATATLCNSNTPSAIAFVVSDQYGAIFNLRDGFNGTFLIGGDTNQWSTSSGTASKSNVYYDGATAYVIENKTGGTRTYAVFYFQQQ